jgi:hypothetical protein
MGAWCTDSDGMDYLLDTVWLKRMQDDELAREYLGSLPRACLGEVYAGHDVGNKVKMHGASGESTMEVFAKHGIVLQFADIDKVNGGRAVNRQIKARRVKVVRTPGNLKVFDQLGEIMPDEVDIRKPGKVDADPSTGVGGDDGADMFRYGIATRVRAAVQPVEPPYKRAHRAHPVVVKDGVWVKPAKEPTTLEELAQWQASRSGGGRVPSGRQRVPRKR